MNEKQIKKLLEILSKEQLISFGLSCVDRTIHLYQEMEESLGKLPKSKNYDAIISILDFVKKDIQFADKRKINAQIRKCENILEYLDDSDEAWFPILYIGESIISIMNYYLDDNIEEILTCSENNLELINQLKSDEYTNTINSDASDKEIEDYLEKFYAKEFQIEAQIIDMIKRNVSKDELDKFISNNKINIPIFIK